VWLTRATNLDLDECDIQILLVGRRGCSPSRPSTRGSPARKATCVRRCRAETGVYPHNGLVAAILGHEYSTKVALSAPDQPPRGQPGRREGRPRRREKEGEVGRREG
jgi:hypothetical protein